MRQSAAHSRHQLLPVPGACAACKWCIAASRWCSDVNVSNGAYGPRSPTQTRPFSSVSALVAAAFGPAVGSAVAMSRERHAVAQLATGGSCIDARPTPVGMAAASAQIGVCRGRECGSRQPSHVISSSPHVVHAAHANGAYQQAVAAPVVARIRTKAIDADTTIFVSIGARSGGLRSCGWFSRMSSPLWRYPSGLHQNQSRWRCIWLRHLLQ